MDKNKAFVELGNRGRAAAELYLARGYCRTGTPIERSSMSLLGVL